jgi:hypothetical protein
VATRKRRAWDSFLEGLETLTPYGTKTWRRRNRVFNEDALQLWPLLDSIRLKADPIFYADPPYSKEHYSRYYHVLETLTSYDYPEAIGARHERSHRAAHRPRCAQHHRSGRDDQLPAAARRRADRRARRGRLRVGPTNPATRGRASGAVLGGSYDAAALALQCELEMDELWGHYGFAPMPAGPRRAPATLAGGMAYAILRQAEQPELAMRLLERLVSPEACAQMSRATAQIPPRRSAVELVAEASPFLSATAHMLASAAVRSSLPAYPRVSAPAPRNARGGPHPAPRAGGRRGPRGRADRRRHRPPTRPRRDGRRPDTRARHTTPPAKDQDAPSRSPDPRAMRWRPLIRDRDQREPTGARATPAPKHDVALARTTRALRVPSLGGSRRPSHPPG